MSSLLILSSEFPPGPGGIGTHAHQLAGNLTRAGWEIVVVTPQDYADEKEIQLFNAPQPYRIVRLRRVPAAFLEAAYRWSVVSGCIRRRRPDVLLATGARAAWLAALLARRFGLPWVAVGHGGEFGARAAWVRALTRWSFSRATSVVCVSEYTWRRMLALRVRPRRGRVIPNGADASRFHVLAADIVRAHREKLAPAGSRVLLSVGNVTERKGHDVVIRAMPEILREAPETRYLVAGLPTRKAELSALAKETGVEDRVRFLGKVSEEELVLLFNCCDVFVMPSRHTAEGGFEGYGIAAVEAALCGKPSVVSANSGLTEAIAEGETGFSVPEGDVSATARAILALLTDQERRLRMGEAARARALSEQTWERRSASYDELLSGVARVHEPGEAPRRKGAAGAGA